MCINDLKKYMLTLIIFGCLVYNDIIGIPIIQKYNNYGCLGDIESEEYTSKKCNRECNNYYYTNSENIEVFKCYFDQTCKKKTTGIKYEKEKCYTKDIINNGTFNSFRVTGTLGLDYFIMILTYILGYVLFYLVLPIYFLIQAVIVLFIVLVAFVYVCYCSCYCGYYYCKNKIEI